MIDVSNLVKLSKAYNQGTPLCTDEEYDRLVEETAAKYSIDIAEVAERVTEDMGDISTQIKHKQIVGSLRKFKASEPDKFRKWAGDTNKVVSAKVDGMSIVVEFKDGAVVQAATRGDGTYGQDKTEYVKQIIRTFTSFSGSFTGTLRGELTLTYNSFEKLKEIRPNQEHKNLRNSTVGIINSKSSTPEELALIYFIPYEIVGSSLTRLEQLKQLEIMGHKIPMYRVQKDQDLVEFTKDFLVDAREHSPYLIDGVVVHDADWSNENDRYYPTRACAFKVNADAQMTTVRGIEWTLGKTSKSATTYTSDISKHS